MEQQSDNSTDFSFLTIAKAARRLGVSRYFVRKMLDSGELAAVIISGHEFVTEASVTAAQSAILQQLEPACAAAVA